MIWYYVFMSLLRSGSSSPILIGFTFIIHYLHPSITFQFCFRPDLLLDLWHGGPFPTRASVLDKLPCYLCLGSELPRLCWLNLKQIALPSIQCIWKWNEYLSPFMKTSVFKHKWMQGKPSEIGFEVYWNEYLKTFMKSSVFKHTWMHEASVIKIRVINAWTKAMENQKLKKAMVPEVISKDCWPHLYWFGLWAFVKVNKHL